MNSRRGRKGLRPTTRPLGAPPSEADLSSAVFNHTNHLQLQEIALVPRSRGGFVYAKVIQRYIRKTCYINKNVEHSLVEWKLEYPNHEKRLVTKQLHTALVGKLPEKPNASFQPLSVTQARALGSLASVRDLTNVLFTPLAKFSVGEIVLVPRSSGCFTYGELVASQDVTCFAPLNKAEQHPVKGWRIALDPAKSMRKMLPGRLIGKIPLCGAISEAPPPTYQPLTPVEDSKRSLWDKKRGRGRKNPRGKHLPARSAGGPRPPARLTAAEKTRVLRPADELAVGREEESDSEEEEDELEEEEEEEDEEDSDSEVILIGASAIPQNFSTNHSVEDQAEEAEEEEEEEESSEELLIQAPRKTFAGGLLAVTPEALGLFKPTSATSHPPPARNPSPPRITPAQPLGKLPSRPKAAPAAPKKKCVVIVDAPNVAMKYGARKFSARGIRLCVDYFQQRGHEVVAFLPEHYVDTKKTPSSRMTLADYCNPKVDDMALVKQLEQEGVLFYTPPQDYDDSYCLQYAKQNDGVIVSNDMYRDHIAQFQGQESEWVRRWVNEHVCSFTFVKDTFMPNPDFKLL